MATQIAKNQINNLTAKGTDALQKALGGKTSSGTAGEITKTVGGLMKTEIAQ